LSYDFLVVWIGSFHKQAYQFEVEIYAIYENDLGNNYKKEERRHGARITPTSQQWEPYLGIEDYELKERITPGISGRMAFAIH